MRCCTNTFRHHLFTFLTFVKAKKSVSTMGHLWGTFCFDGEQWGRKTKTLKPWWDPFIVYNDKMLPFTSCHWWRMGNYIQKNPGLIPESSDTVQSLTRMVENIRTMKSRRVYQMVGHSSNPNIKIWFSY